MIHTDFERGFIRAETIAYDDFVKYGGEAGARDAGKLRLEGKDYVVADGDVMHFRFHSLRNTRRFWPGARDPGEKDTRGAPPDSSELARSSRSPVAFITDLGRRALQ